MKVSGWSGPSSRGLALLVLLFLYLPSQVHSESTLRLKVGDARIEVIVMSGSLQLSNAQLLEWVRNAAESVATYYGRFPVPRLVIRVSPFEGKGVRGGRTFPTGGGLILIRVGGETTRDDLAADWMMTHEMVHLSFPSVGDRNHWIEEGIAITQPTPVQK